MNNNKTKWKTRWGEVDQGQEQDEKELGRIKEKKGEEEDKEEQ